MIDTSTLIKDIKDGDHTALREVYREFKKEFIGWSSHQFNLSTEESQEAFQFAVVTFYENVINGKLEYLSSSLKTYLFAIGKNKAMEYSRRKNLQLGISEAGDLADDIESEDDFREREERFEKAKKSMAKLGSPCSEILMSFYYQKRPLTEIATQMGYKSMESLKSQKYKCMERLRSIYFSAA